MLKISKLQISNIGPINNLTLDFHSHFNVICGGNGIGKTTILDCLAQTFTTGHTSLKKTAGVESGFLRTYGISNDSEFDKQIEINFFKPEDRYTSGGFPENNKGHC